jgi:hypothetical protein
LATRSTTQRCSSILPSMLTKRRATAARAQGGGCPSAELPR